MRRCSALLFHFRCFTTWTAIIEEAAGASHGDDACPVLKIPPESGVMDERNTGMTLRVIDLRIILSTGRTIYHFDRIESHSPHVRQRTTAARRPRDL